MSRRNLRITVQVPLENDRERRAYGGVLRVACPGVGAGLVAHDLPPEVFAGLRNRVLMGMIGDGVGLLLALVAPRASLIC
jgi:hypothetical protein